MANAKFSQGYPDEEIPSLLDALRSWFTGLRDTVNHWDELDAQHRSDAKIYYAYTISVIIGAPILGVLAVWVRLR
jgi:hypothetical protein